MLHAVLADGFAPGSYAMTLARERRARLHRMSVLPTPAVAPLRVDSEPTIGWPAEILVYPTHVFAGDADRGGSPAAPNRIREIQDLVCKNLMVRRADLLSARRDRLLVTSRQIAMYLCKRHTPNSFPDIGRRFGGRDHTTVLHAVRRVALMMKTPMGTSISPQWQPGACDFVRHAVNLAEVTISTWGEDRVSRIRHPARSGAPE